MKNSSFFSLRSVKFITILATLSFTSIITESANAVNLVINGTFDNNSTGWTGTYLVNEPLTTINTGNFFFAGINSSNTITQTYNLTVGELANLNNGGLGYTISGDLFGFRSQTDNSTFTASFFDGQGGTGTLLSSVSLSSSTNFPGNWPASFIAGNAPNFQSSNGNLNTLTRSILFNLTAVRVVGNDNDGYADNLSFNIQPTAVPFEFNPAVGLVFLGGLLASRQLIKKAKPMKKII
jgi:hypothetical protein